MRLDPNAETQPNSASRLTLSYASIRILLYENEVQFSECECTLKFEFSCHLLMRDYLIY